MEEGIDAPVYAGIYRNYFMKVYYTTYSPVNYGDLWVDLYYNKVGAANTEYLIKTYDNSNSIFYLVNKKWLLVDETTIRRNDSFYFWNGFNRIKKNMDYVVDIAEREKLEPSKL